MNFFSSSKTESIDKDEEGSKIRYIFRGTAILEIFFPKTQMKLKF